MKIIDAHQHFWQYDPIRHDWISENMSLLKKDFLPEELLTIYQEQGIQGCVAVQAEQSIEETEFLLDLADEHAFIKGVVGWVDLSDPDIEENLSRYEGRSKLVGFRHVIQDEPDDWFAMKPGFKRGVSCLSKYGFTYDILIYPHQMPAVLNLIEAFPNQKFIIDHLAKPDIANGTITPWKYHLREIASHSNVYCKLSGMVTEADWYSWSFDDLEPFIEVVFEAFGVRRIAFGSDWPVCLLAADFEKVKNIVSKCIVSLPEDQRSLIWSDNAIRFYDLDT